MAQGTVSWGNVFGTTHLAPVYSDSGEGVPRTGNTATGKPVGSQVYGGTTAGVSGTGFTVQLFVGNDAAGAMASTTPLDTTTFRTGTGAGFVLARTATDALRGPGTANVNGQLRAWNNRSGAVTTWAMVMADDTVSRGLSDPFVIGPLGGTDANGNIFLTPQTTGVRSFQLFTPVPEPSVIALGALGLGALLLRRRKQS